MISATMEPHEELLEWATSQGVTLDGVAPRRIPGRGIGLIATRTIKPEEILLEVPSSCLRSITTVPRSVARKLPSSISVHGLLAADLALDTTAKYDVWNAVCPTPEDFSTMPLVWPQELQDLLPRPARELLSKQQAKFCKDWSTITSAFPNLDEARYRYAWMLVNTRTFYYLNARLQKRDKEDHMCLQPVADLFNHADEGCHVSFDAEGFSIKATCAYAAGNEVKICYGRHSGDFLLVEYGFVMDNNRWDEVALDDVVLGRLNTRQKERLEEAGFLGKYVLDREAVCYRTQVALRLSCCGVREWRRFVDGVDDGEASQGEADKVLLETLERIREHVEEIRAEVDGSTFGEPEQRGVLKKRWEQIRDLIDANIIKFDVRNAA
ncbi:SET domain-containing protein [Biscogniauxia marginata]|nr:SET domain-containing protein [Biscogniauxia marginata]